MIRLTGFAVALMALALALGFSGSILTFIDLPSILIVVGLSFGGILTGYGKQSFSLLLAPLKKSNVVDNQDYFQVISFYQFVANLVIGAAFVAVLVAVIGILSNMDDPKNIGPNLALALLSVFYSVTFILIFILPIKHHFIQSNSIELNQEQKAQIKHEAGLQKKMIAASCLTIIISVSTLYLSLQPFSV